MKLEIGERTTRVRAGRVISTCKACGSGLPHRVALLGKRRRLGELERKLNRRIEEHHLSDPVGVPGRKLHDQPPAERMPDPIRLCEIERVESLQQVADVRFDRPGRVPGRSTVAAKIDGEHPKPVRPPLFGELLEPPTMTGSTMDADNRWPVCLSPLEYV